ncbi:MAG: glycoside hydrolase [Candidatus Marinimicrobia bacterium]|nr:glycoside hydrolase [Candidatus Neomarinimicrobiota bacterium]
MIEQSKLVGLRDRAIAVLRDNDIGYFTKPAPQLYPHQWNWDSALIAIGLSHFDPVRAQSEINALLAGQWKNGMIPHIIFNPEAKSYFPGPDFWGIEDAMEAPKGIATSGITQPPLLALAAYNIYCNIRDKIAGLDFLESTFDAISACQLFFRRHRNFDDSGLACIIHPWESGLDNSPAWDPVLEKIKPKSMTKFQRTDTGIIPSTQRPDEMEYSRYAYLVELYKKWKYSQKKILHNSPFIVESVVFNTLLLLDLKAMLSIGKLLKRDMADTIAWISGLESAINTKLFDPNSGCYCDYDCRNGRLISRSTISEIFPICAGIPSGRRRDSLIARLKSDSFWPGHGFGLTTVNRHSGLFDSQKYWRGPVWININWFFINNFFNSGDTTLALRLMENTIQLVSQNGFFEYYSPETGEGLGASDFSWTAALIIDMIEMNER